MAIEFRTDRDRPEPPQPPPSEPAHEPGTSGLKRNVAAGLACIFSIVGGVVFLVIEKKDAFVRFYAMQSILLGAASLCANVAFYLVGAIFAPLPFFGRLMLMVLGLAHLLVALAILVAYVITIIKAFSNVEWEIPYLGKFARRQLRSFGA